MSASTVLQIVPFTEDQIGGVTSFTRGWAEELERRGLEVTTAFSKSGENLARRDGQLAFIRRVSREESSHGYAIFHAHAHWYALEAAVRLHRRRDESKVFFTFHTEWDLTRRLVGYARSRLSRCAAVTFVSGYLREQMKSMLPSRIQTCVSYPGVRSPSMSAQDARSIVYARHRIRKPWILWVGNLTWVEKSDGLRILIRAALDIDPSPMVVVIGDGPFRGSIEEEFSTAVDAGLVLFLGQSGNVWPYYLAADIYAHVTLRETLGISLLEAMACGKPCIATMTGGLPELIANGVNGLLSEPTNESVRRALTRLLRDPGLQQRLGSTAAEDVLRRFSWDSTWNTIAPLYGVL